MIEEILIGLIIILIIWILKENKNLEVTDYIIEDKKIPQGFNGFKIAQLSDLHNWEIGKGNKRIVEALWDIKPDIIVVTGDFLDHRKTKVDVCIKLSREIVKIAPVYFINGNHEIVCWDEYVTLRKEFENLGVVVLENSFAEIEKGGEKIRLCGLHETGYIVHENVREELSKIDNDTSDYKILLAHKPEMFGAYDGYSLILSGHSHGGQIRVPFVGGIFAPGQGLLPEFDGGKYQDGEKTMIVSRGLGNSLFPVRVNNRPEIVMVELRSK